MAAAAPTSVSAMRSQAAEPVPSAPTPSTSIPLIATSTRLALSRSACPRVIATKMSRPRLHQRSGTTEPNATARVTPETTAMTRSRPLDSSETGVTWTTSIAVSGASSGSVSGNSSRPTTKLAVAATVTRSDQSSDPDRQHAAG